MTRNLKKKGVGRGGGGEERRRGGSNRLSSPGSEISLLWLTFR